ncbi:ferritin-like domain-containing protein [Chthonobacter albigriseus]|uniref:YciE/YciF ferroxidase family protein n=1 Tax=Chthonobacter albigriseus TaxID=1683161 RepID=UPI0015EFA5CC|nr:ferritin-like domain-containing protein [Chthonobacter albigriseus]
MKTLNDLFLHMLKDVYHAEKQILRALPKMAKTVTAPELRKALELHREETLRQVERLEQVFELLDKRARGEPCEAMQGLIEEAKSVMEEAEAPEVIDAGVLAASQAVEHYEISRYGTLIAWATQLGLKDAVPLLTETLEEEKKTDRLLTDIAEKQINRKAA